MTLTPAQELRRELLFIALDSRDGTEAALETAARLEAFVLHGQAPGEPQQPPAPAPSAELPSPPPESDDRPAAGDEPEPPQPAQARGAGSSRTARSYGRSRRRAPSAPSRRAEDSAQREAEIASFIARNGVSQPPVTLETVANFVRERDYSVVRDDDGRYVVDGRKVFTPEELLDWANRMRRRLNRPPFPSRVLQAEPPAETQPAERGERRPASSANGQRATGSDSHASPGAA